MLRFGLFIIGGFVLTILAINVFFNKKIDFSPQQYNDQILHLPEVKNVTPPSEEDTLSIDYHFYKIVTHFSRPFYEENIHGFFYRPDQQLKNYYLQNYIPSNDSLVSKVGAYSLTLFYFYKKE